MDYSIIFVCLMGMGTVFFGLVCLIGLNLFLGLVSQPVTDALELGLRMFS